MCRLSMPPCPRSMYPPYGESMRGDHSCCLLDARVRMRALPACWSFMSRGGPEQSRRWREPLPLRTLFRHGSEASPQEVRQRGGQEHAAVEDDFFNHCKNDLEGHVRHPAGWRRRAPAVARGNSPGHSHPRDRIIPLPSETRAMQQTFLACIMETVACLAVATHALDA